MKVSKILFLGFILIPLSLVSMFLWDQKFALYLDSEFGDSLDRGANMVTWIGLADQYFWICIIGYLGALLSEKYLKHKFSLESIFRFKKYFKSMFWAFTTSGLLAVFLKFIIGRCRPYNSPVFDALYFKPFTFDWNFQSYPSGHTQVSFTLAAFLSCYWPKFSLYLYSLAVVVAISRVILDYHFLGDVFFGAYIGILGVYLSQKLFKF